jgi:hypothetical protein
LSDERLDDLYIDAHLPGDVEKRAALLREAVAGARVGRRG